MTETTELMLVTQQNAVEIFTKGGMRTILDDIERKVRAYTLDPSTPEGREQIRSVAYKVAKTKVALDNEGKKLTEGWREATKRVNEERKLATERLESLAEEVRKPLTEFENKERRRVDAHETALKDITGLHAFVAASPDLTLVKLEGYSNDLRNAVPDRDWEEFAVRAQTAREEAAKYIGQRMEDRKRYEVEQEELAQFRKEEAERLQRERDERLKAEAAEAARIEAELKAKEEAERIAAENERVRKQAEEARKREEDAKIAAEKRAKDAEEARIAAEKKAESDRIAAQKKADAEKLAAEVKASEELKAAKEEAKRAADAAAQREREKIEKERKQENIIWGRMDRAWDEATRKRVRAAIVLSLRDHYDHIGVCGDIADALLAGKVPHCKVIF